MSRKDYSFLPEITDEDVFLLDRVSEWFTASEEKYVTRYSAFLDERQCELCRRLAASRGFGRYLLWGGYEGSERNMLGVFAPFEEMTADSFPIRAVTFSYREADRLTHRDFLGALMSLELTRDSIGDIIVGSGRSTVFLRDTVAQEVLFSVRKIGRVGVSAGEGFSAADLPEHEFREITGFAASLRADCVLAIALGTSREKAARLIRSVGIAVDHIVKYSPDTKLAAGSGFSVKGHGKFLLKSIDGVSKKDRIHITVCKFV